MYNCDFCDENFYNDIDLINHFNQTHIEDFNSNLENERNIFKKKVEDKKFFPGFDYLNNFCIFNKNKLETECFICTNSYNTDKKSLKLLCCKKFLCNNCLIKHINYKKKIICPFCNFIYH